MMEVQRALDRLRAERDEGERELARMRARRKELATRKVLDERRRERFLRRLDGEIGRKARELEMVKANIAGLEV